MGTLEGPEGLNRGDLRHRHCRGQCPLIAQLNDRMPLIVAPNDYDAWLGAGLKDLPGAVPAEAMRYYPVSRLVSNARNDLPACLDPIDDDA